MNRPRGAPVAVLVALATLGAAPFLARPARAHVKSISYSSWRLDPRGARVEARMSALDASAIVEGAPDTASSDRIGAYLARRLQLYSGGASCTVVGSPARAPAAEGWIARSWRVDCPATGAREIRESILLPENPAHLHFARATLGGGDALERVLGESDPSWALEEGTGTAPGRTDADGRAGAGFARWIPIGADHLLTGQDHLAFLAALLLLARSMGEVATTLAAFALATSMGLAAGGLGVLAPSSAAVGALVGFSVALAAAEDSWLLGGKRPAVAIGAATLVAAIAVASSRRHGALGPLALSGLGLFSLCRFGLLREAVAPAGLRAGLAFAFGLVHGLGFAPAVAGLDLPPGRLVPVLLGFNLGIAAALFAAAAIAWPLFRLAGRLAGESTEPVLEAAAAGGLAGLGTFWFVARTLG